ncbi:SDR family oxidoreductase [Streptomyces sp. SCUT-3]|nr:hypothetical protein C0036_11550 [Streptomyces sp. DJ]QMV24866.1 SDR family oxidoreductase [Streptomyces sp. SCUT-3]
MLRALRSFSAEPEVRAARRAPSGSGERRRTCRAGRQAGVVALPDALPHPGAAYTFAKRANHLRVQAASLTRGARGARVNTISLGVVSTPMGRADPAGESGVPMRALIESSGTGRNGAPNDIAEATAWPVPRPSPPPATRSNASSRRPRRPPSNRCWPSPPPLRSPPWRP